MTETQQRFLRAIVERVPAERVVELHLFPPMRQGGVETGVAVVAERPELSGPGTGDPEFQPTDHEAGGPGRVDAGGAQADVDTACDPTEAAVPAERPAAAPSPEPRAPNPESRLTVHTARYRLTLKGVDRGKWEVDVVAEADAPVEAVNAVVRGVQRRAGEGSEPERLTTGALRAALDAPGYVADR